MSWANVSRRGFWLFTALHLALWTTVSLLTQPNAPLDTVEVVAWGHEWQLGYQNHPPLTAWLAEAARLAGGANGVWAIYLLTQLAVVTAFWGVWRLALHVVDPATALVAVLLTGIASRYTWMTLELNHNAVVLPFFSLSVLCFYRALSTPALRWWILTGVCLGLGALAKYTIAVLGLGMLLFLVADRDARRSAQGWGPYAALGVATLIVLPHLVWLVAQGFPPVSYALKRAENEGGLLGYLVHPLDFLGHQLLSVTLTLLAVLALLSWPLRVRTIAPDEAFKRRFLLAMVLGPPVLVVLTSLTAGFRLHPAWGMPFWTGLALLLLFSFEVREGAQGRRRAAALWALGSALNVLMATTEVAAPHVTGRGSRIQFPGRLLAEQVSDAWQRRVPTPLRVVAGERWLAGNVGFYARSRPSILTNFGLEKAYVDEAACPWTSVAYFQRRGGVLLWFTDPEGVALPEMLRARFPAAEVLPPLALPWQTTARIPPVRVGVAIVVPTSGAPPR